MGCQCPSIFEACIRKQDADGNTRRSTHTTFLVIGRLGPRIGEGAWAYTPADSSSAGHDILCQLYFAFMMQLGQSSYVVFCILSFSTSPKLMSHDNTHRKSARFSALVPSCHHACDVINSAKGQYIQRVQMLTRHVSAH